MSVSDSLEHNQATEFARRSSELEAWLDMAGRVIVGAEPIHDRTKGWPADVCHIAEVLDGFARGMMSVDALRPECPNCHGTGQIVVEPELDSQPIFAACPANNGNCDGRMTVERMSEWCGQVLAWDSGPHTREELLDLS